jgi:hypothetical protein
MTITRIAERGLLATGDCAGAATTTGSWPFLKALHMLLRLYDVLLRPPATLWHPLTDMRRVIPQARDQAVLRRVIGVKPCAKLIRA